MVNTTVWRIGLFKVLHALHECRQRNALDEEWLCFWARDHGDSNICLDRSNKKPPIFVAESKKSVKGLGQIWGGGEGGIAQR